MISVIHRFSCVIVVTLTCVSSLSLETWNEAPSRRSFIQKAAMGIFSGVTCSVGVPSAVAQTEEADRTRPFASSEALLPAAKVKRTIDRAADIAAQIQKLDGNDSSSQDPMAATREMLIQKLVDLVLTPQDFNQGYYTSSPVPQEPAKQYMDAYKNKRGELNILAQPGAMLVQSGEIGTWRRLKRQERRAELEDESGIRAAFNAYTSSLSFSADSYALNLPKTERSQLIRDGRLPDVKQVIASDMGLRLLYRNQVLNAMEDARFELRYQIKEAAAAANGNQKIVVDDIVLSLKAAQAGCQQWFGLIDSQDISAAMQEIN